MPNENPVEDNRTEKEIQSDEEYDKVFFGEDNEPNETAGDEQSPEADPEPDMEPDPEQEEPVQEEVAESESEPSEEEEEPEQEEGGEDQPEAEEGMVTLKWRGKEIQVTQQEAIDMAQQNFDVTHKYQEVAKMRKQSEADLDLLDRVRKGDKDALAQLAKSGEIDPLDLLDVNMDDIEQGSDQPAEPFLSPEVAQLMEEVSKDENLYNELAEYERVLPQSVVNTMAKDAESFYAIVNEVRSGDASIVMPQVQARLASLDDVDRAVVMNNSDAFASFYVNVKQDLIAQSQKQPESKPKQARTKVNPKEVGVRRSNTQKRGEPKKLDSMQSDKAYQAILDRLANSQ